jgi:hypothetical protein
VACILASISSPGRMETEVETSAKNKQAAYIPLSNHAAVADCQENPRSICLAAPKEHKQSFARCSNQPFLGTRPGRISSAGSGPRDSAFSQRSSPCTPIGSDRSYFQYYFELLRMQRELCQILFLGKPSYEQSQRRQRRIGKMSNTTACVAEMREAKRTKGREAVICHCEPWLRLFVSGDSTSSGDGKGYTSL